MIYIYIPFLIYLFLFENKLSFLMIDTPLNFIFFLFASNFFSTRCTSFSAPCDISFSSLYRFLSLISWYRFGFFDTSFGIPSEATGFSVLSRGILAKRTFIYQTINPLFSTHACRARQRFARRLRCRVNVPRANVIQLKFLRSRIPASFRVYEEDEATKKESSKKTRGSAKLDLIRHEASQTFQRFGSLRPFDPRICRELKIQFPGRVSLQLNSQVTKPWRNSRLTLARD